jgi:hypothetical protein
VCLQERTACSSPLTPEQLSSLTVAPRQLDFGKLSPASPGQQCLLVTNPLAAPIHIVLNLSAIEGLSCNGPCSQVVPAGGTAKFVVQLHCHDTQHLKEHIQYVINGCQFQVCVLCTGLQASVMPMWEGQRMSPWGSSMCLLYHRLYGRGLKHWASKILLHEQWQDSSM